MRNAPGIGGKINALEAAIGIILTKLQGFITFYAQQPSQVAVESVATQEPKFPDIIFSKIQEESTS
jgi:hypothetical protein